MLAAALAIAAVAALATWSYVNGADKRAYADASLVKVFRVKADIPKGMPGEQAVEKKLVVSDVMPQKFRPATAVPDASVIRGKVALTNLSAGQVVVEGQFVDPKIATVSFAQRIPNGQVAVTIQVSSVTGVANLVVPGDKVNVIAKDKTGAVHTMMQNVNVLAVGTTSAPQAGETPPPADASGKPVDTSGLITFAVPQAAAEKIAFITCGECRKDDLSEVYLTLVAPDNTPIQLPVINHDNVFQGGLTPYGP